jgi:hypothetical protein
MKRVPKESTERIKHCWLYKEDIGAIVNLLTVDGIAPEIKSDGFVLDDADELYEYLGYRGRRSLSIKSDKPLVILGTYPFPSGIHVSTYDQSNDARALFSRVVEAVKVGERKTNWRGRYLTYLASLVLAFGGAEEAYSGHGVGSMIAGFVCLIGIALFISHVTYSKVEGTRFFGIIRADRLTFLQRNKDALLVALITGVVCTFLGAALGVAGTLFSQHLSK